MEEPSGNVRRLIDDEELTWNIEAKERGVNDRKQEQSRTSGNQKLIDYVSVNDMLINIISIRS